MAMSAADPHHYSFNEALLPLAVEKQMGIIGMKIPGRGRLLSNWTPQPREAQTHMWEGMASGADAGDAHDARGDVLHALAAREHDYCGMRFDCAAGGECGAGAGVYAAER